MKQIRFSVVIVPALLLIAGIGYFGWWAYPKLQQEVDSPYKAIPPDAALVIRINNPAGFINDVEHSSLLWKEISNLPGIHDFRDKIHELDSMIRKNDGLFQVTQKHPLLLSMSETGGNNFSFLFLITFNENNPEEKITRFIEDQSGDNTSILVSKYGAGIVIRVTGKGKKEPFFFTVRKGIFMGSFQVGLLKKAIDQVSLNIPSIQSTGFMKAEALTQKKADANIFICYPMFYPFLVKMLQEDWSEEAYKSASFADWTALDLVLKKDEILVNGYTTITDTAHQYAGIFAGQTPQKITIPEILPDNTTSFIFTGLSDILRYNHNFQAFAAQKTGFLDDYPALDEIQRTRHMNLADHFLPWIGNELCIATVLQDPEKKEEDSYAIFKVKDPYRADSLLKTIRKEGSSRIPSVLVNKHMIFNCGIPDLIPGIFGKKYARVSGSFYTFIAEYVVFGNDPASLKSFTDHYYSDKTLSRSAEFEGLKEHLSENTNLFYYFSTARNLGLIKTILNDELASGVEAGIDSLRKFESVTLQLSNNTNGFFTSFFIHYNPSSGSEGPLKWQTSLDTTITGTPQLINLAQAGSNRILVTDKLNNLYSIDPSGNIRWKIELPEKPLGQVLPVCLPGQDSAMFLLNTNNFLCLITCKGLFADKFPVKLKSPATAGLTLIPGKFHESGVLIPLSDKKIHLYSLTGKNEESILNPELGGVISKPVQVLQSGKKDYLFVTSGNGEVAISDLKGNTTTHPPVTFRVSKNSMFYLNLTNKKGVFIADDPSGKVLYLDENNKFSSTQFNMFTPDHLFFYDDINRDGSWEFVFFDKNKLTYYNRFFKLLYSYTFTRKMTIPPYSLILPDGTQMIGAVSEPSGDIYLFGKDGILKTESGIRGSSPFQIADFDNSGDWDLVIGSGKILKDYRLPKE